MSKTASPGGVNVTNSSTAAAAAMKLLHDKLEHKCIRCRLFYASKDALGKHVLKNKKCIDKIERTKEAIAAELEGIRKRKQVEIDKEDLADYRCSTCDESFAGNIALINKGTSDVGCIDCSSALSPFEEEYLARTARAKKKAPTTPITKKEGLRSKELVPEDRKLFYTVVSCMIAVDKRNECMIPYTKISSGAYEAFLTPEMRVTVNKLKGVLKYDC